MYAWKLQLHLVLRNPMVMDDCLPATTGGRCGSKQSGSPTNQHPIPSTMASCQTVSMLLDCSIDTHVQDVEGTQSTESTKRE